MTCWRYEPRKWFPDLTFIDQGISAFHIGTLCRPLHNMFDFGANYPVYLSIPAYHLPVYASPCTLPYTTQDSVLGCWLSFTKVNISILSFLHALQGASPLKLIILLSLGTLSLIFYLKCWFSATEPLVQAGIDLPTVKRISGHKTLQMVERYSHQNGAHIQAAMDKLEQR